MSNEKLTKNQLIKKYWQLNDALQMGEYSNPDKLEDEMIEISGILDDDFNYRI